MCLFSNCLGWIHVKIFLKNISLCILTRMNLLPPIPPQTSASHILFACVFDGRFLAPRPCPCMLVRVTFNNVKTFYIQTHFISKHNSKAMFGSLTRIWMLSLKAMGPMMCSPWASMGIHVLISPCHPWSKSSNNSHSLWHSPLCVWNKTTYQLSILVPFAQNSPSKYWRTLFSIEHIDNWQKLLNSILILQMNLFELLFLSLFQILHPFPCDHLLSTL